MNQREAKRLLCRLVARELLDEMNVTGTVYQLGELYEFDDHSRLLEAATQLVDELLRRAGMEGLSRQAEIEGQMSIEDFLPKPVETVSTDLL